MGKPWALEKEEKGKEARPSLCEKNSQGAQKGTRPRYLETARTKGDSREMPGRISWDLDSSRKHAYGHKKQR